MSRAKDEWEKVSFAEFMADVERARREAYRLVPHRFKPRKRFPWQVCSSCGLVRLRNKLTEKAVRLGCMHQKVGNQ